MPRYSLRQSLALLTLALGPWVLTLSGMPLKIVKNAQTVPKYLLETNALNKQQVVEENGQRTVLHTFSEDRFYGVGVRGDSFIYAIVPADQSYSQEGAVSSVSAKLDKAVLSKSRLLITTAPHANFSYTDGFFIMVRCAARPE